MSPKLPDPHLPDPQLPEKYPVVLDRDDRSGSISVDLESFARFNLWIDQELQSLDEEFSCYAAPRAVVSWRGKSSLE